MDDERDDGDGDGGRDFFDRLGDRIAVADSVVSVGLDPDPDRIPGFLADADLPRWAFNRRVIDATHEHAAAFKPNAAFYEDPDGWRALRETVAYARGKDVPVVLDAKRADIGNTARQYARSVADLGADAVTVNPYMGRDSLAPFLDADLGAFVLCRTSNAGGADLQDADLAAGGTVYERVARLAAGWSDRGTVGLVVGATAPEELAEVRDLVPDLPFLVPGVGAQGGDAEAAVEHGLTDGVGLVNSSRGIIFAGEGADDEGAYFRAAGESARRLKRRLNRHRD
ncbi:MAG: orotidine-5'-phosphate decarboxylase [Haloferacaceae archaeon]